VDDGGSLLNVVRTGGQFCVSGSWQ